MKTRAGNDPNMRRGWRGQLRLTAPAETVCTLADTYYKIAGVMSDGHSCGFSVVDNKLKYSGPDGAVFLFSGSSDARVSKATDLTYGLHKNGELIPEAQSPHTFPAAARISNLSITAICMLDNGDDLDVYMKSSEANLTATVRSLNITFWS